MYIGDSMAKLDKGVLDTGPCLHLHEIKSMDSLNILKIKVISAEVEKELYEWAVPVKGIKNVEIKQLLPFSKDIAKFITDYYSLQLGEATSIALAQQEKITLFFTDDLEAREVAKSYKLEVHGTLGILLRAFREKIIQKNEVILLIDRLQTESSLFITSDLIIWIKKEVEKYTK